jgi:hypothetical protein
MAFRDIEEKGKDNGGQSAGDLMGLGEFLDRRPERAITSEMGNFGKVS